MTSITERTWDELANAARSRSPFNFLQLATSGLDGSPQLRTVVLRRCDPKEGTITFITDTRSPKAIEIGRDPRVSLLGFDPARMIQLRLSGDAQLITDEQERHEIWAALPERTTALFKMPLAPGTAIDDDGDALHRAALDNPDVAFARLAVIIVRLSRLEWLDVSGEDHLRWASELTAGGWKDVRLSP